MKRANAIAVGLSMMVLAFGCSADRMNGGDPDLIDGQQARHPRVTCKMPDGSAALGKVSWAGKDPSRSFFTENRITEIRYVRAAAYVADPKPVKVLSLDGLSDERMKLLAAADVASWRPCYENDRVCDGMHWIAEFVSDGKVVKRVSGFNAEPPGFKFFLMACGLVVRPADPEF